MEFLSGKGEAEEDKHHPTKALGVLEAGLSLRGFK
eukprot:CAMPEP_0114580382 /NCGR_PEP_ID=MMETSP0125-20121206/4686_1 /TAXON_ID=485358 ORGANISM="Aristerostoma sp., Strain ATCC 50986" /NCGR_SAMPLE_ID=MMETSP0125 /ASSEMBLY_ACC=CAM_ASM_000245 /LENGTH=34 /DNA_ID= /DNA_START= /DNA_END= /DNA_ORIENTATION=